MRGHVPSYQLVSAATLPDALATLAREPGVWHPFAGGTDLMVLLESGKLTHKNYLNIWNLAALRGIEVSNEHVTLGALTTYTEVQSQEVLRDEFPMLCQAASETGGLAIQNRGTLGGNIVNASPAADSPPALLAYNAEFSPYAARAGCLTKVFIPVTSKQSCSLMNCWLAFACRAFGPICAITIAKWAREKRRPSRRSASPQPRE